MASDSSDTLLHDTYLRQILKQYIQGDNPVKQESGELSCPVPYGKASELTICPEPVSFLSSFNEIGNDKNRCRELFSSMIPGFETVNLPESTAFMWWNTTRDRINLRLGIDTNTNYPVASPLGDVTVHGLIAGQTGSGKSVLLHNLIFNLMAEYPPWELDLYLADFKRVEFSKYMMMEDYQAPHVAACAATGEIRYVLSLIQHLVDCMNAREDFFKRMGFEKIGKFRKHYPNVVLPRILLIVDEFQQLFLDASTRESEHIHRMLTAIVKKGRATGVHIVFASQEMSQTLSRSDLANFRMRIALNCDPNVSMDVLGNRGAAECKVGYVMMNCTDYSESSNRKFRVPYVETEVAAGENRPSYFDSFIMTQARMAQSLRFTKNSKFYQEDYQEPIQDLEKLLDKVRDYRTSLRGEFFDALTLGRYVTYSPLKYDIQTLFLERGRNKNILAVSPNTEDIAYLQQLFALNFKYGPHSRPYRHILCSFQPSVERLFSLGEDLSGFISEEDLLVLHNPEDLSPMQKLFTRMRFMLPIYQEAKTPLDFVLKNYDRNIEAETRNRPDIRKQRNNCIPLIVEAFGKVTFENAEQFCPRIAEEESNAIISALASNLLEFCRYKRSPSLFFRPTIVWLNGVDSIERLPEWLVWMLKNGMDYQLLFICMAASDFDNLTQINKYCDYLFLGGGNRRIYDRLNINFTARDSDSIVLDLQVKSTGEEHSFKKYRYSFAAKETPRIPFETLL